MVILRERKSPQHLQLSWGCLGVSNPPSRKVPTTAQKVPEWCMPAAFLLTGIPTWAWPAALTTCPGHTAGRQCGRWGPQAQDSVPRLPTLRGPVRRRLAKRTPTQCTSARILQPLLCPCALLPPGGRRTAEPAQTRFLPSRGFQSGRGRGGTCTPAPDTRRQAGAGWEKEGEDKTLTLGGAPRFTPCSPRLIV